MFMILHIHTYVFSFYMFRYTIYYDGTQMYSCQRHYYALFSLYTVYSIVNVSYTYMVVYFIYVQNHAYTEKINHQRMYTIRYPPQKHI